MGNAIRSHGWECTLANGDLMQKKRASLIAAAACIALIPLQEAHADLATAIARQAAKQASKRAADQAREKVAEMAERRDSIANTVVSILKESGISGVVVFVSDCYSDFSYPLDCIYADVSGKYVDDSFTSMMGFPNTPYYDDFTYNGRMNYALRQIFYEGTDIDHYHSIVFKLMSTEIDKLYK